MISSRLVRKLASLTAVLGILFAQFAVATYACPLEMNKSEMNKSVERAAVESAGMPCHQNAKTANGLCEAHCQDGQKNVPGALTPPAVDFVAAFIVRLPAEQPAQQIADAAAVNDSTPHHSPPILLRNGCFRI